MAPRGPRGLQDDPKMEPIWTQDDLKRTPEAPRGPQDGPKRAPIMAPRSPQEVTHEALR